MKLEIINRSGLRVPRAYLEAWLGALVRDWRKQSILSKEQAKLSLFVAFVDATEIQQLNKNYRDKSRPTDVLSFASDDPELLGELVICPQVIKAQALEHGITEREEFAYMLTHGLLHLLGYEHEEGGESERIMYELQDKAFEKLRTRI